MSLLPGSGWPALAPAVPTPAGAAFSLCPGTQSRITAHLSRKCQTCARYRYAINLDPDANTIAPELSGAECANYINARSEDK